MRDQNGGKPFRSFRRKISRPVC
uniref:Uncharacterized protein n=1 Tax=Anguilla anguilla TaxID=7936 RepID=A0A0E9V650_ANGAN